MIILDFLNSSGGKKGDRVMTAPLRTPDLSRSFPMSVPDVKITPDRGGHGHGEHSDLIQGILGGTEQVRISPNGDVLGGTTRIGRAKMDWSK